MYRYKLLANELESKIANGTYKVGEKLPSIRQLHRQLNLSISTIYKAFIELEAQGLIEARPRSGYYVGSSLLRELRVPATGDVSFPPHKVVLPSFVNQVLEVMNNPAFLPFGSAILSPDFLPYKSLFKILKDLGKREVQEVISYNLSQGDPELRRQLALRTLGIIDGIGAEDIIVTNGCTEAVSLSLKAVVQAGDTIAIESPTFYGILPLLEELGVLVVEVPTDPQYGVDVDGLEETIRRNNIKACLLTPNFHNPLGALMPDERKKRLVRMLNCHDIPIIEDDVNSELYYGKQRPIPLIAFDKRDLVLTCSSFSKTLASGLRTGWVIPGKRFKDKVLKLKTSFSVSTSSLDQHLLARFLGSGVYERHLRSLRDRVKKQVLIFARAVQEHFPEDTRMSIPQGGLLLWIQLPRGIDGFDIYREALKHRISILPGIVCSSSKQFKEYIRIGCGFPFTPEMKKGIEILGALIGERCRAELMVPAVPQ
ncbi:MAG: PLP-dependent aminotransferase family protein [Proteobacteria bacterium]|nr:PLP-dependent aminotransferase family protein [Pseudomonadota bacterium]